MIPAISPSAPPAVPTGEATDAEEDEVRPSSARIVYKTYATTFTYLTTFFTGDTSSVSSREEIVSSVVTLTQSNSNAQPPSASPVSSFTPITPSASSELRSQFQRTRSIVSSPVPSSPLPPDSPVASARTGKYSVSKRLRAKQFKATPVQEEEPLPSPTVLPQAVPAPLLPSVVEETILKTFYTTYTYVY